MHWRLRSRQDVYKFIKEFDASCDNSSQSKNAFNFPSKVSNLSRISGGPGEARLMAGTVKSNLSTLKTTLTAIALITAFSASAHAEYDAEYARREQFPTCATNPYACQPPAPPIRSLPVSPWTRRSPITVVHHHQFRTRPTETGR